MSKSSLEGGRLVPWSLRNQPTVVWLYLLAQNTRVAEACGEGELLTSWPDR